MSKLTKKEAIAKIDKIIDKIDLVKTKTYSSPEVAKWRRDARIKLSYVFGKDSEHVKEFENIGFDGPMIITSSTTDSDFDESFQEGLKRVKAILESMVDEINEHWADEDIELKLVKETFWKLLHPRVVELARGRFENGQFADAVEAVLKDINSMVKRIVKDKTGREYDGSDLMNAAFSLNKPIIILDDLNTVTGKNIQQGYMQIFAGAMTGIRNPKAHDNVVIDENRAVHFLFLGSLLMTRLDEKIPPLP